MRLAIYAYTERGEKQKAILKKALEQRGNMVPELAVREAFQSCELLIFIGATGIAVRKIAPYLKDKFSDPAVLCLDEHGMHCIALLSGHVGGANAAAVEIANITGAEAVISTATDLNHCFAVDLFAKEHGLQLSDRMLAKSISAALLRGEQVGFSSELPWKGSLPEGLIREDPESGDAALHIHICAAPPAERRKDEENKVSAASLLHRCLFLYPRPYCLGIGCRRGADAEEVLHSCFLFLKQQGISPEEVGVIASIDLKAQEAAILSLKDRLQASYRVFSAEQLLCVPGHFSESSFVKKVTGVGNVCERAAAAVYPKIVASKTCFPSATFALGKAEIPLSFREKRLTLVIGGAFQGKHRFVEQWYGNCKEAKRLSPDLDREELEPLIRIFLQKGDIEAGHMLREKAEQIGNRYRDAVLILPTVGNGIVPGDAKERAEREVIGRLSVLLSEQADAVWKLECGIPIRLK